MLTTAVVMVLGIWSNAGCGWQWEAAKDVYFRLSSGVLNDNMGS
jgi:hypothetical protein